MRMVHVAVSLFLLLVGHLSNAHFGGPERASRCLLSVDINHNKGKRQLVGLSRPPPPLSPLDSGF